MASHGLMCLSPSVSGVRNVLIESKVWINDSVELSYQKRTMFILRSRITHYFYTDTDVKFISYTCNYLPVRIEMPSCVTCT